jgi:hypothetical protein
MTADAEPSVTDRPPRSLHLLVMSGGQTGVDRAAWDAARQLGLPIGGWVPRGRLAEDGEIPTSYGPLRETKQTDYAVRTECNVRDADATLVLHRGAPAGGTLLTIQIAERLERPLLAIDLGTTHPATAESVVAVWLAVHRPRTLNVAGPRASSDPGIYAAARALILNSLSPAR